MTGSSAIKGVASFANAPSDEYGFSVLAAAFAENPKCAAIYVDAAGIIRSWNRGAETLFGYSATEVIGRRADIIVPQSQRDAHWSGFNRAILSSWRGSATWDPIEPLHRGGSLLALEVFLLSFEVPSGALQGVLALFRARFNR
jgi:PAS domain S-box-containing protein